MANRFWVGGTDTWNATAGSKWSTTSGGAGGAATPTSADDVFFDAASSGVVTISGSRSARSVNCTGFTGTIAGSGGVVVGDATAGAGNIALKLVAGMTFTNTGQWNLSSTDGTQQSIDFGGKTMGSMFIDGVGGSWVLNSVVTTTGTFSHTGGTLDTNDYNMTVGSFAGAGLLVRSLSLGASHITITGGGNSLTFGTTTNLTFNAGTSLITFNAGGSNLQFGSLAWYDVECSSNNNFSVIGGSPSFRNLTFTPASSAQDLTVTATPTISGTFTVAGSSATTKVRLHTNGSGNKTITSAANAISNIVIQDITGAGAASWNFGANNTVGDIEGNSGITFIAGVTLYYIGDGATGNAAASWSTSSGGGAGSRVPLPQDSLIFDANSFSTDTNFTYGLPDSGEVDFSAIDQLVTVNSGSLIFYGDVILDPNLTFAGGTYRFYHRGTQHFDPAGLTNIPLALQIGFFGSSANVFELDGDLSITGNITTQFTTFESNDFDITADSFTPNNNAATINLGSSNIILTGVGAAWNFPATPTLNAGTSTILLNNGSASTLTFAGGGKTYYNVDIITTGRTGNGTVSGNNTFSNRFAAHDSTSTYTLRFTASSNQTFGGDIEIYGVASNLTVISTTTTNATFTKTSGTVVLSKVNLKDITATGGATFYASNSVDNGDNPGWSFSNPLAVNRSATFAGTSSLTMAYDVHINLEVAFAGAGVMVANVVANFTIEAHFFGTSSLTINFVATTPAVEVDKNFVYKVYDNENNFLGQWNDVVSDFSYSQEINSAGSAIDVILARNSDIKDPILGELLDSDDENVLTDEDLPIIVTERVAEGVGPGSNVQLNLNVVIYIYYGSYGELGTEDSEPLATEDDIVLSAQFGSPNGRVFFRGYISKFVSRYGEEENTLVTLTSYGSELDNYLVEVGGDTSITYNSYDPSDIARDVIDLYEAQGGVVSYDTISIDDTGNEVSYTFNTSTTLEAIKKVLELSPGDWFWYLDMANNFVNLHGRPTTPNHYFVLGKHIQKLDVEQYIEDIVNAVYFSGGEISPGVNLYKKYLDPDSEENYRRGLLRISDNRVILEDSADIISRSEIERNNSPRYRSAVTILDKAYEIETIKLGDLIGFRNFGNYVDALTMQVVAIDYTPEKVQLQLDTLLPRISKRLEDIKRNLDKQETVLNPVTPDE